MIRVADGIYRLGEEINFSNDCSLVIVHPWFQADRHNFKFI
jgi:hypothetical protein